MLNILSILIGVITLVLMIPAMIPLLGWMNWLLIPMGLVGALIGWMSASNMGRNFCLLVVAIGALRLFLGGGII